MKRVLAIGAVLYIMQPLQGGGFQAHAAGLLDLLEVGGPRSCDTEDCTLKCGSCVEDSCSSPPCPFGTVCSSGSCFCNGDTCSRACSDQTTDWCCVGPRSGNLECKCCSKGQYCTDRREGDTIVQYCECSPYNCGQSCGSCNPQTRECELNCPSPNVCTDGVCACDPTECGKNCGECSTLSGRCEVNCNYPNTCNNGVCACDPAKCETYQCATCQNGECVQKTCPIAGQYCLLGECVCGDETCDNFCGGDGLGCCLGTQRCDCCSGGQACRTGSRDGDDKTCQCEEQECAKICGKCNSETKTCDVDCGYPNVCNDGSCECNPDSCKEKCNKKFKDGCCLNGKCTCCPAAFTCPLAGTGDECECVPDRCKKICNGICDSKKCLPQCDRGFECYTDTCRNVPWLDDRAARGIGF